jgi:hypothetical protein
MEGHEVVMETLKEVTGHVNTAFGTATLPSELTGAPKRPIFKWLLEGATLFCEVFDIVTDLIFAYLILGLDQEAEDKLPFVLVPTMLFILSFIVVNLATDEKTFGQLHPKLQRCLSGYTPTDPEDRVHNEILYSPCKAFLTIFVAPTRWIANSIFHQIIGSILYLVSFVN